MRGCSYLLAVTVAGFLWGCSTSTPKVPEVALPVVAKETAVAPKEEVKTAPTAPAAQLVDDESCIFFRANTVEMEGSEVAKLHRHIQRLKDDPKLLVTLIGRTDNQGSRSYNLAIAEQRVRMVFRKLLRDGVPRRQLRRYPAGKEKNSRPCTTVACQERLQRVELVFSPLLPRY